MKTLDVVDGNYTAGRLPEVINDDLKNDAAQIREQLKDVLGGKPSAQWLKDRIMVLLMHWHHKETPQQVINAISQDWINVLKDLPQWSIEEAIVEYNRSSEYKPVPANIVKIAERVLQKYRALDWKCKRILEAENTKPYVRPDEEGIKRGLDILAEVKRNLAADQHYIKKGNNDPAEVTKPSGYEVLNDGPCEDTMDMFNEKPVDTEK